VASAACPVGCDTTWGLADERVQPRGCQTSQGSSSLLAWSRRVLVYGWLDLGAPVLAAATASLLGNATIGGGSMSNAWESR
jgi:hypothetical protein